ncbi:hypothetical protein sr10292 [Sporisorium reilianum SRZ2]|uniref:Uncharacterized protein n=1 Tax=Sporisorium reilianum (strain SRZ2) TaxID=999809 RepID=E6ZTR7_SPORE|nr:hypothetical protein sr10292 [Sporisorium reilianum SRZ2]
MLLFLLFLLLLLLPFPLIVGLAGWLAGWLAKSSLVSAGGECPKKKAGEPRSGKRRVSHFHQR